MRRIISGIAIIALGVALAGCSGKSGGGGNAAAMDATLASFAGEWKVTAHIVAPWFTGPGFDPKELSHAANAEDPTAHMEVRDEKGLRVGGFGIMLTRGLVDELKYNSTGNEVRLVKRFPKPD